MTVCMLLTAIAVGIAAVAVARNRRLSRLAFTDPLTGCLNRRGWHRALRRIERRRRIGRPMIAICDVRGLSEANRRGHDHGDRLLRAAADELRSFAARSPAAAAVARLGGDEFGLLLADTSLTVDGLTARLDLGLTTVGAAAAVGASDADDEEPLSAAWRRADLAAVAAKHRPTPARETTP